MEQCIKNKGCSSSLEVTTEEDCELLNININTWKTITINDNLCNDITGELIIQNSVVLESITIGKNSLKKVSALTIKNNNKLTSISIGDNSFYGTDVLEIAGTCFDKDNNNNNRRSTQSPIHHCW